MTKSVKEVKERIARAFEKDPALDGKLAVWANLSEDDLTTIITALALYTNMLAENPELLASAMDDAIAEAKSNNPGSSMAAGYRDIDSVGGLVNRLVAWRKASLAAKFVPDQTNGAMQ